MQVQTVLRTPAPAAVNAPLRAGFMAEEMVLRHLTSKEEIQGILHLRDEIDLSALAADANFAHLEKKETNSGSSSDSNSTGNS